MIGFAAALWLLLVHPWRRAASRAAIPGLTAAVVACPWPIHTAQTWGSPFRSDAGYLISGHAYYWEQYGGLAIRVWHSPAPPAPFGRILREHTATVVQRSVRGIAPALREFVRSACASGYPALMALLPLTAAIIYRPAVLTAPSLFAVMLYFATLLATLSFGGRWAEGEYFTLVHVWFAA
jgi:hypothetical protein